MYVSMFDYLEHLWNVSNDCEAMSFLDSQKTLTERSLFLIMVINFHDVIDRVVIQSKCLQVFS